MQNLPNKKLLIYALVFLVVVELVWGVFYLSGGKEPTATTQPPSVTVPTSTSIVTGATISILPKNASIKVGQTQKIDINVNTAGKKISGIDAVLEYDPTLIEIVPESIVPGNIVKTLITKKVDLINKKIVISGVIEPNAPPFEGQGNLATLTIKGLSKGTALLSPLFTAPGNTKDSNVVEATNGKDALAKVIGGTYTVN